MGRSDQRLVSNASGTDPLWGPDGRELFYLTPGAAMVVPVETRDAFRRGTPQELFSMASYYETAGFSWDISPDGQRFLMIVKHPEPTASQILVIENWAEEVKSLEPTQPRSALAESHWTRRFLKDHPRSLAPAEEREVDNVEAKHKDSEQLEKQRIAGKRRLKNQDQEDRPTVSNRHGPPGGM